MKAKGLDDYSKIIPNVYVFVGLIKVEPKENRR